MKKLSVLLVLISGLLLCVTACDPVETVEIEEEVEGPAYVLVRGFGNYELGDQYDLDQASMPGEIPALFSDTAENGDEIRIETINGLIYSLTWTEKVSGDEALEAKKAEIVQKFGPYILFQNEDPGIWAIESDWTLLDITMESTGDDQEYAVTWKITDKELKKLVDAAATN